MPNFLRRTNTESLTHGFSHLLHSRESSPHKKPDLISNHKQIEEETQPKYNPEAFYPARFDEVLNDRYRIVGKLGYGMTATVWFCKDLHASARRPGSRKYVCIKININTLTENWLSGRRQIAEKLATAKPSHEGYSHVRFMLDTFKVKGPNGSHLCIVYDVLREPIGICMQKFKSRLFSSQQLRLLLPALLQGLDYMHSEARVVHTDLKPDNVMMGLGDPSILEDFVKNETNNPTPRKSPDNKGRIIYQSRSDFGAAPSDAVISSAKIIDIGLAAWGDERHNNPIQSNAFTAPEVILAYGWSYPADIWNLGVMLWDLIEDFGLFDAIDTRPSHYRSDQHLGLMIALMGPPPTDFLAQCGTAATYFDSDGNFRKAELAKKHLSFESSISRMKGEEKELFLDFVKKMVTWRPEDRWTAHQLLQHPYLTKERSRTDEINGHVSSLIEENVNNDRASDHVRTEPVTRTTTRQDPSTDPTTAPILATLTRSLSMNTLGTMSTVTTATTNSSIERSSQPQPFPSIPTSIKPRPQPLTVQSEMDANEAGSSTSRRKPTVSSPGQDCIDAILKRKD